jgi:nucleotide-binding universal stress UspA family protein
VIEIRRILCPVDLSEFSGSAVRHAAALARWYGAEIYALYVMPRRPLEWTAPPAVDEDATPPLMVERLRNDMAELLRPAAEMGIRTHQHLRTGDAAREIAGFARAESMDLVVMGTHGRGGFRHFVLGSVADKISRTASCPVLTVGRPGGEPDEQPPFQRILCPIDFSATSRRALTYALSLAEEANAELTLLHVTDPFDVRETGERAGRVSAADYRRLVESRLAERLAALVPRDAREWCRVQEVVVTGEPWEEIVRVASDDRVQLIVIGLQPRSPIDKMLFGSTAREVVRYAMCPVLAIGPSGAAATEEATDGRAEHGDTRIATHVGGR